MKKKIKKIFFILIYFFIFFEVGKKVLGQTISNNCLPPNKPQKILPINNQIFKRDKNGIVTIELKFNDGADTGCYPHQSYFQLSKGMVSFSSGWLNDDKYLIKAPYQPVSYFMTLIEDGLYAYRVRSRNKLGIMGPYDNNPYIICVDSLPPQKPDNDVLRCFYDSNNNKFNVTYSWDAPPDQGCAGKHNYSEWAQISTDRHFSTVLNYNSWDSKNSIFLRGLTEGTILFAHLKSRDKIDNQTEWTLTKSIILNCNNCSNCLVSTPTPTFTVTPTPTNTPTPTLSSIICENVEINYLDSKNEVRTKFTFKGNNNSQVSIYPNCYYSLFTNNLTWLSMSIVAASVNPSQSGRPFFGHTTGELIYKIPSNINLYGNTYISKCQALVFYDLNSNKTLDFSEPYKYSVCPIMPTVIVPNQPSPLISISPTPTLTPSLPPSLTPTPTIASCNNTNCFMKTKGDANCDCKIDFNDLNIWKDAYIKYKKEGIFNSQADFNFDQKINMLDYLILRKNYSYNSY